MSGESQLDEDMLHPLIDNMLKERQDALEKVNAMFGTNISVSFNSAWELNEREQEAAIETIESEADNAGMEDNNDSIDTDIQPVNDAGMSESEQVTEETEEITEEQPEVEVTITEQAVEEIAEAVAEKLEEDKEDETDKEQSDDSE